MSCNVKTKAIEYLKKQGAISQAREIANPAKFEELNEELTKLAFNKYNVGDGRIKLFGTTMRQSRLLDGSYVNKYVFEPNETLFTLLDEAVEAYNDLNGHFKVDPNINEKYFSEGNTTAKVVLEKIAKSDNNLAPLAEALKDKVLVDVNILPSEMEVDIRGAFYSLDGVIKINPVAEFRNGQSEGTILHEILHYLTFRQLEDKKNPNTIKLEAARKHAEKVLGENTHYGLFDVHEFAVAIYTDAAFIKALKGIPPVGKGEYKNFLEEVVQYLLELIGLDTSKDSFYEQVAAVTSSIIEQNVQAQKNELESFVKHNENLPPLEDVILYSRNTAWASVINPSAEDILTNSETIKEEEAFDFEKLTSEEQANKEAEQEDSSDTKAEEEVEHGIQNKIIHLRDISEKLDDAFKRINKSLEITKAKYRELQKIYKNSDPERSSSMAEKELNFSALQAEINSYEGIQRMKGIVTFVDRMTANMEYVKKQLGKIDYTKEKGVFYTIKNYDAYLKTYGVIDVLQANIAFVREQPNRAEILSDKDLERIEEKISEAKSSYSYLKERMHQLMLNHLKEKLNDLKYFPDVVTKHRNRLRKEHSTNAVSESFNTWYPKMMKLRDKDLVDADLKERVATLIYDPAFDIAASNTMFVSANNTGSALVQIYDKLFQEMRNIKIKAVNEKKFEFKEVFDKLIAEKGTNNIITLYSNLYEQGKNGKFYLKGEYNVSLIEAFEQKKEISKRRQEIIAKYGVDSNEYKEVDSELDKFMREHFTEIDGKMFPKDKYKNDLTKLSTAEQETLKFLTEIQEEANKNTYRNKSLVKRVFEAKFYEFPKVTKTIEERLWTGKIKGTFKDGLRDLSQIRPDDVGYSEVERDGMGNVMYNVPIHYRDSKAHPIDPDQQSLDLMTIYFMEYENGITYKIRNENELEMNMLLDMSREKDFYDTRGTWRQVDRATGTLATKPGHQSEVHKMMKSMMESKLYDILNKSGHKLGKLDLNKAVSFVNGITAFLGMTFNFTSGTANLVNANAQLFLESFIKGHFIKADGVKKANLMYAKHLHETLIDNTRGVKVGFINQLNTLFDVRGLLNVGDANFMQSDLLKSGLTRESLQVFQNGGEHWIQSVIAMSVLDGIKVMNADNNFIDKDGKVVQEEKDAASLLDMLEKNDKGVLQVSDKVVYTTHSPLVTWKEGGKENVDGLIEKKIFDSVGNYKETTQPDIQRHYIGKLFMMYRRYLVPMGVARFRGLQYSHISRDELDEGQANYSYSLQENEEGTYVSLVRYVIDAIKRQQYNLLSKSNWDELSDYHKHNIKRAVTELVVTSVMIPLVLMALQAMADDDDEMLYFVMYQLRRLDTELKQYRSPGEMFKIIRSPIPSTRILETALGIFSTVFSFSYGEEGLEWGAMDTYDAGRHKYENKLLIKLGKQFPVLKDMLRSYKDLFEFQNSDWGSGL